MQNTLFNGSNIVMYKAKRQKYIEVKELTYDVVSNALGGGGTWLQSKPLTFKQYKHNELWINNNFIIIL